MGNSETMPSQEVKKFVDGKIAGKKVMVFSKSYCPYCTKAKNVFKVHLGKDLSPEDYEILEIENRKDCNEIQAYLKELTGASSVPRVYINGKCIGGGNESAQLESSGQLAVMLKA